MKKYWLYLLAFALFVIILAICLAAPVDEKREVEGDKRSGEIDEHCNGCDEGDEEEEEEEGGEGDDGEDEEDDLEDSQWDKDYPPESILNDHYLQDDMYVTLLRNGLIAPPRRWPKGRVFYKINKGFAPSHFRNIKKAMSIIESISCIRFRPANKQTKYYIRIIGHRFGCNAAIGYRKSVQYLNLQRTSENCAKVPVILHELLHILGFFHQHVAPDRDKYIKVLWENILPDKEQWFHVLENVTFPDFGFGYDLDSILHYGRKAFSQNGLDTIVPIDSTVDIESMVEIGERMGLSPKDIGKLNALYNCTKLVTFG